MSINDLMENESFLPTLLIIFLICFFVAIVGIAIGKAAKRAEEDSYPIETNTAKILSKRSAPHPMSPTVIVNYVLFELSSGTRIELTTSDSNAFGIMLEGDVGSIQYQGKRLLSLRRNTNN